MRQMLLSAALTAALVLPTLAQAEAPIETYEARLSHADHLTSKSERLDGVAEIIRQDRVNIYKYDSRDPEDQTDTFFKTEANRLKLETLIANGDVSAATREEILYGTPVVQIVVYRSHVDVTLKAK
jgi:hypothetical protein